MVSHHTQKPRCRKTWLRPHATVRWSNNLLGFESGGVSIERLFTHEVASTQIYWTKEEVCIRKECNSRRIVLVTPIWPPWRHVKTLYKYRLQAKSINVPRILIYHVEGMVFFTKTMRTCWQVYSKVSFSTLIWQFFSSKRGNNYLFSLLKM